MIVRPQFTYVSPSSLRFDSSNPRFGGLAKHKSQPAIQTLLEQAPHYAIQLVDSLLENGFIDYEPLVVRKNRHHYVVIEGNRRLAAVRHILANPDKYADRQTNIPDLKELPVLVFPNANAEQDNKEQRVYLGVRHLFGFREWPAESKAKFLNENIKSKQDLTQLLRELNIQKTEIRRYLIPYRLRKAAGQLWKPYTTQDFWVLGEALSRSGIKEYIALDVDRDTLAIRAFDRKKLRTLLGLLYGVPKDGRLIDKRITETRGLSALAAALKSRSAARVLERGGTLDEASVLLESHLESRKRLNVVLRELGILLKKLRGPEGQSVDKTALLRTYAELAAKVKVFLRHG